MSADGKTSVYKQGLQHYAKGEFEEAIQDLQKALKARPSRSEKVKIYKYIGLSLYTLGRQAEAEKNFEQCLATDRACSIEAKEALDESVLPFFQKIKRSIADKKNASQPKTRILVKTPVKDAEVMMDGILLGPANMSLDVKPGAQEITLLAKGYRPRRVKIAVNKLVENVYEIDLEKLPPTADLKEKKREKVKQVRLGKEKEKERERDKEEARKLEARKVRDETKDKVPPVLPSEDEATKKLAAPAPDSKRQSMELPEEKDPQTNTFSPTKATAETLELNREPVSFAHFMPLGVGQFYNRDYILGTLILGTQLYAAGAISQANQDIQQAEANEQAAIRRAQTDPTVTEEALTTFKEANQSFVKDKKDRRNLALGVVAGTYIFGVFHALIMRPYVLPQTLSLELQPLPNNRIEMQIHWDF
jgi:tetratricopeptide (TPR) repeat protein